MQSMRGVATNCCAMAVMAKAPLAGRSKTRLVPPLTPEQAAAMSAAFLRDITENIALASHEAVMEGLVAYAPAEQEHLFEGHLAAGTRLVLADGAINTPASVQGFGRCLLHAVQTSLAAGYGSVCVVNSDSPNLPTGFLVQAAKILARPGERAVLGPAEDGGYYLLGVKTAHAHLFSDIAWSTESVAAQTLLRAREIGLEIAMLPRWYDVDDAPSLRRLLDDLAEDPHAAPATRTCVARCGLEKALLF